MRVRVPFLFCFFFLGPLSEPQSKNQDRFRSGGAQLPPARGKHWRQQPTHAAVRFWGGREVYTTNEKLFSFLQAILFFLAHAFLVSASASYVPSTGAQMGDDTRRRLRARASSGDSCASGLEATEEAVVEVAVVKEMVKEKKKNNYIVSYITYPNKKPAK